MVFRRVVIADFLHEPILSINFRNLKYNENVTCLVILIGSKKYR